MNRFNRYQGVVRVTESKFIIWTAYTYCVLDLQRPIPSQVDIISNHPYRTTEGKQQQAQTWFDNLKLSQAKYLDARHDTPTEPQAQSLSNLMVSNKLKGILAMEYEPKSNQVRVVENLWKKAVSQFENGAFVPKKFAK